MTLTIVHDVVLIMVLVAAVPAMGMLILQKSKQDNQSLHIRGNIAIIQGIFVFLSMAIFAYTPASISSDTPCYWILVVAAIFGHPVADILIIRLFQFYNLYNQHNNKSIKLVVRRTSVFRMNSQREEKVASFSRFLANRIWFDPKFIVAFVLSFGLLKSFPIFILVPVMNPNITDLKYTECDHSHWLNIAVYINMFMTSVTASIFVYLACLIRSAADSLGIKKEFKNIGLASMIGVSIFSMHAHVLKWLLPSVADLIHPSLWITLLYGYIFYESNVRPVRRFLKPKRVMAFDSGSTAGEICDASSLFIRFLASSEEAFRALLDFSAKEFSSENIRFLKCVQEFEFGFADRSIGSSTKLAVEIYADFLSPDGEYEVNLPSEIFLTLREKTFRNKTREELLEACRGTVVSIKEAPFDMNAHMFAQAQMAIAELVIDQTLDRFISIPENMKMWYRFFDELKEIEGISAAHLGCKPISVDKNDDSLPFHPRPIIP